MPYLRLWHGRSNPDEELSTWGEDGPVFGPFPYFHMTYGIEIKFSNEEGHRLSVVHGLVYYDGMYYGDWSFFDVPDSGHLASLIPFDQNKAVPSYESD